MRLEAPVLENRWVRLEPLSDAIREEVRVAISVDEAAWSIMVSNAYGPAFDAWFDGRAGHMAAGGGPAYAVRDQVSGRVVGVHFFNHKITWTGRVRDTVMFAITDEDWPTVRERLDARLAAFA